MKAEAKRNKNHSNGALKWNSLSPVFQSTSRFFFRPEAICHSPWKLMVSSDDRKWFSDFLWSSEDLLIWWNLFWVHLTLSMLKRQKPYSKSPPVAYGPFWKPVLQSPAWPRHFSSPLQTTQAVHYLRRGSRVHCVFSRLGVSRPCNHLRMDTGFFPQ